MIARCGAEVPENESTKELKYQGATGTFAARNDFALGAKKGREPKKLVS